MKKGKVFGKGQILVALMLVGLGTAIWLNAKYAPSATKYLGEASYVNGSAQNDKENTVETAAKPQKADFFEKAIKDREKIKDEAKENVEELLDNKNLSEEDKKKALTEIEKIGKDIIKERNIETLLKAKGFNNCVAVIGKSGINVIVKSEGLTAPQTLQIQDIVTNETDIPLSNIKIIPVNK